jgi:hypothetical protein
MKRELIRLRGLIYSHHGDQAVKRRLRKQKQFGKNLSQKTKHMLM